MKKRSVLTLGFLNVLTALGLGRFIYSLCVPYLNGVVHLTFTQIGLTGSALVLGYLFFSYIGGVSTYHFGERTVIISSLVILATSFLMFYRLRTFPLLTVSAFLMGSAAASLYVNVFQMVHRHFDVETFGKHIGLILSGAGCGILVLSLFASFLLKYETRFDVFSIWIVAASIALVLIAANGILQSGGSGRRSVDSATRSIGYARHWKELFVDRELRNLTIAYCFYGFAYSTYLTYVVAHEAENGGESTALMLWALFGASSIVSSIFWGRRADGDTTGGLLFYNYGFALLGIFLPAIFSSTGMNFASSIIFGLSFFGYLTIFGRIVVRKTGALSSVYMGKITLIHAAGQIVGVSAGGRLRDLTGSFAPVFALSFAVGVLSLWFYFRYTRVARRSTRIGTE